ncbi:MAG TPA: HD domain-containing protein [Deltaproteobacteria bacterium]|nr:HD domain-containing protein [Deltaproteobacteria bacterium]
MTDIREGIRRKPEAPKGDMRDAFSIDVDRILHSRAYTAYIDKTQVFYLVGHPGISHRVIHVQLLSRIARTIGRRLGLNDDLIEAIAIGHDIGHPPFGHDGEKYLGQLCEQAGIGEFRHNIQGLHALETIEKHGTGLNLTLPVLDGILCHNGEMTEISLAPDKAASFADLDRKIALACRGGNPLPATLEGCLVRVADTVSYIGRDIEDAITLGIIKRQDIPRDIVRALGDTNGKIVYRLVEDLIANSTPEQISYSPHIFGILEALKAFNYRHIYLNTRVKAESEKIRTMYDLVFKRLVEDITEHIHDSPIFTDYLVHMDKGYVGAHNAMEITRDYIAGLTDSAFLKLFNDLYVPRIA